MGRRRGAASRAGAAGGPSGTPVETHPVEALRDSGDARRSEGRISYDLGRAGGPSSVRSVSSRRTLLAIGACCGRKYLARRMVREGSGERSRDTGGGGEEIDWRLRLRSLSLRKEHPRSRVPRSMKESP